MLLLFICLFYTLSAHAILYKSAVLHDATTQHITLLLAEAPLSDKRSCSQQYQLIKEMDAMPESRLITVDLASSHPFRTFLSIKRTKEFTLQRLHHWAQWCAVESTNVEFRPFRALAPFYASRMIKQYAQLKKIETDFVHHQAQTLQKIQTEELPIINNMRRFPGTISWFNYLQRLKKEPEITPAGGAAFIDCHLLAELSAHRKQQKVSVVVAETAHIDTVTQELKNIGYQCCHQDQTIEDLQRAQPSWWAYDSGIPPVDIAAAFNAARATMSAGQLITSNQPSPMLNVLYYRGAMEEGSLAHVNRTFNFVLKGTHRLNRVRRILQIGRVARVLTRVPFRVLWAAIASFELGRLYEKEAEADNSPTG